MKRIKKSEKWLLLITIAFLIVILIPFYFKDRLPKRLIKIEKPISVLSYSDIVKLSREESPDGELLQKLQKQLSEAYIVNNNQLLAKQNFDKPFIRVAHWNIERGINLRAIKNIFIDPTNYYYSYKNNIDTERLKDFRKELDDLSRSDIILLNEVDIGMPRTKYKNVVAELAQTFKYNYAFATEFIEVGPVLNMNAVDPEKFIGLHGNAILSKYPIQNARIVRLPKYYDWYKSEIGKRSLIEKGRRAGAKTIFREEVVSEVRHGTRCALIADIELSDKETITVVSTHLEDRCYPDCRFKQIEYLFNNIKNVTNPLILAGDLNTSTTDNAPTSMKKEIVKRLRDRDFVARQIALAFIPVGIPVPGVANVVSAVLSKAFQYKDPAFPNIPVFFPNHERKLFKYIKSFRFADEESFDTRGNSDRSSNGKRGLLANSNERQLKGFESTFKFEQPRVIAYYKLDWFLVKPKNQRFEPFNGQTLKLVNEAYTDKVSDHDPIIVDLTLVRNQEIKLAKK